MNNKNYIILMYNIKINLEKNGDIIKEDEFQKFLNKIRIIENTNFIDFSEENRIKKIIFIIDYLLKRNFSSQSIEYLKDMKLELI